MQCIDIFVLAGSFIPSPLHFFKSSPFIFLYFFINFPLHPDPNPETKIWWVIGFFFILTSNSNYPYSLDIYIYSLWFIKKINFYSFFWRNLNINRWQGGEAMWTGETDLPIEAGMVACLQPPLFWVCLNFLFFLTHDFYFINKQKNWFSLQHNLICLIINRFLL